MSIKMLSKLNIFCSISIENYAGDRLLYKLLYIFEIYLILYLKVYECINSNINQILIKIIL